MQFVSDVVIEVSLWVSGRHFVNKARIHVELRHQIGVQMIVPRQLLVVRK